MRLWTKAVDEDMHPACAEITFACCHRHIVHRLGPDGVKRFLDSTQAHAVTPRCHDRKKQIVLQGFDAPEIANPHAHYHRHLDNLEETLDAREALDGSD